jgi:uncharacterized protein (TIGR02246 family)
MQSDEEQIRLLTNTWMTATKDGDVETVMSLMTEDVIFLIPGRPPMRKIEFAATLRAQTGQAATQIDGSSEIQEITVSGDWAFMWTKLTVVATPPSGGATTKRAGHTLTVLKKENGRWLLARDANLLTVVPSGS